MTPSQHIHNIDVVNFPRTRLAVLEHHGPVQDLPNTLQTFIMWRKAHGTPPSHSATYNILHNNPHDVPPSDYRFDIGAEIKTPLAVNTYGVIEKSIPEGLCARFRIKGDDAALEAALTFIYGSWLPDSVLKVRDFPPFLQRISNFPDVAEHETETDLFLPIHPD